MTSDFTLTKGDVADACGCSIRTISRVFARYPRVPFTRRPTAQAPSGKTPHMRLADVIAALIHTKRATKSVVQRLAQIDAQRRTEAENKVSHDSSLH